MYCNCLCVRNNNKKIKIKKKGNIGNMFGTVLFLVGVHLKAIVVQTDFVLAFDWFFHAIRHASVENYAEHSQKMI